MFKRHYDKDKIEPNPARDWRRLIYTFLVLVMGLFITATVTMRGLNLDAGSDVGRDLGTSTSLDPEKLLNPADLDRVLRELGERQAEFERQRILRSTIVDPAR